MSLCDFDHVSSKNTKFNFSAKFCIILQYWFFVGQNGGNKIKVSFSVVKHCKLKIGVRHTCATFLGYKARVMAKPLELKIEVKIPAEPNGDKTSSPRLSSLCS